MIRKSQQEEILKHLYAYRELIVNDKTYDGILPSLDSSINAMEHLFDKDDYIYIECVCRNVDFYKLLDEEFLNKCKMDKLDEGLYKGKGEELFCNTFFSIKHLISIDGFIEGVESFSRMVNGEEEDLLDFANHFKRFSSIELPPLTDEQLEEINYLNSMRDDDIDFSDIPEITEEQWSKAKPLYFKKHR